MKKTIKVSLLDAVRINNSKKEFILLNTKNDCLIEYRLTNSLDQWFKHYNEFRVLNIFKSEIKTTVKL